MKDRLRLKPYTVRHVVCGFRCVECTVQVCGLWMHRRQPCIVVYGGTIYSMGVIDSYKRVCCKVGILSIHTLSTTTHLFGYFL